ncbi:hypothetical protein [Pseudomonas phage PA10]|uniref:Uncharacterized protein n=1 Tax=Pseudomonas phage PA10 TaxID=1913575 RepID=A0A1J0MI63_9CAUD|nr:hypothetical protein FDH20_gp062 [Pseudomonas phage PA10]APD20861.1 hypothetical protein [Pseudomonas phage PA10]
MGVCESVHWLVHGESPGLWFVLLEGHSTRMAQAVNPTDRTFSKFLSKLRRPSHPLGLGTIAR